MRFSMTAHPAPDSGNTVPPLGILIQERVGLHHDHPDRAAGNTLPSLGIAALSGGFNKEVSHA